MKDLKKLYKDIKEFVELKMEDIDTRIKQLVLQEANIWPECHNIRKTNR